MMTGLSFVMGNNRTPFNDFKHGLSNSGSDKKDLEDNKKSSYSVEK